MFLLSWLGHLTAQHKTLFRGEEKNTAKKNCIDLFLFLFKRTSKSQSSLFTLANRPFYRYGGHIELIRFKKYFRMPRGHEHIICIFKHFLGHFFLKFSQNKIVMRKKILVLCLDEIMIPFFQFSIRNMVFQTFTVYFWGKRRSSLHPNTAQQFFFPLQSYSKKTLRKNVPKCAHKC